MHNLLQFIGSGYHYALFWGTKQWVYCFIVLLRSVWGAVHNFIKYFISFKKPALLSFSLLIGCQSFSSWLAEVSFLRLQLGNVVKTRYKGGDWGRQRPGSLRMWSMLSSQTPDIQKRKHGPRQSNGNKTALNQSLSAAIKMERNTCY